MISDVFVHCIISHLSSGKYSVLELAQRFYCKVRVEQKRSSSLSQLGMLVISDGNNCWGHTMFQNACTSCICASSMGDMQMS